MRPNLGFQMGSLTPQEAQDETPDVQDSAQDAQDRLPDAQDTKQYVQNIHTIQSAAPEREQGVLNCLK